MAVNKSTKESIKPAKIRRRNGKGALTHIGKTVSLQVAANTSTEEVRESLSAYIEAFTDLTMKHEELVSLIADDNQ